MPEDVWAGFRLDPRRPEHARIRATDADRDHARELLARAYADGRLTRPELDARSADLAGPITLGALLQLVRDLEPTRSAPEAPPAPRRSLARELAVFVVTSAACLLVWWLTGRGFFWPLWVMVYTGLPPLATVVARCRPARSGRGNRHTR